MHGLKPPDLFVFHDWHVEAMKKIEDHANTRGWAIIRHQTTCVLSCVGPAESNSTALLDQDDWISADQVARLWVTNKRKNVTAGLTYRYGNRPLAHNDVGGGKEREEETEKSRKRRHSDTESSDISALTIGSSSEDTDGGRLYVNFFF